MPMVAQSHSTRMDFNGDNEVFKVGNSVYLVGSLDYSYLNSKFSENFLNNIISLLDRGNKFIPCYIANNFYFYSNIINIYNNFAEKINKHIFFSNKDIEINKDYLYLIRDNKNNVKLNNSKKSDIININDDFIEDLCKNLKIKNVSSFSFPKQVELLDLEFELFKNFDKFNYSYDNNNISKNEFISLKQFIKYKPFKVVQADKNLGTSIMSNQVYDNYCLEHLKNIEYFISVNDNPLIEMNENINNEINNLLENKFISKRIYEKCLVKNPKLGKFRILIKLHKPPKISTRPIVNCIDHPTSNIASIIDYILQPFVKQSEAYLKDSQQLIAELNSLKINKQYDYYAYDIEGLYLNLILDDVLDTLTEFLSRNIDSKYISIEGVYSLLKIVLFNNYIYYNNSYYLQIKGISMGCKCAPAIANLYLSILEKSFLTIHKPFYYKRYIDDLFIIVIKNFNIENLFGFFKNLKLILSCKNGIVNFLDVNIFLNYTLNKVIVSLYIKPTQNFSFLLSDSNHPDFIFKNSPKSILIRIRRNCTNLNDFLYFSNIYLYYFLKRGYSFINWCKVSHTIALLNRDDLLNYKIKSKKTFPLYTMHGNSIFDKNLSNFNDVIINNFDKLKEENVYKNLRPYELKLHNNMQPNIGAMLIHNIFSFNFNLSNYKFFKCEDINCKVCSYSSKSNTIKIKNYILPILCSSSCSSKNFIYIINCNICKTFYIGQSKRSVKERLYEHIYSINSHLPFKYNNTTVSNHFNLKLHNISNFSFFIYNKDIEDDETRLATEAKLIFLFKNIYNINIINNSYPCPYEHYKTYIK